MMTWMDLPTATMAFFAVAAGDPAVALAEEGIGPARRHRGLAEHASRPSVALIAAHSRLRQAGRQSVNSMRLSPGRPLGAV